MDWSTVFLVAALVVLLLFIIYAAVRDPDWARATVEAIESPWEVYGRSTDVFDGAARTALRRATARRNPTPGDHLLAATVIRRGARGQAARPRGAVGRDGARQQARERIALFDQARHHYAAALAGLGRGEQVGAPGVGPGFVLDEAAAFAFGGLGELLDDIAGFQTILLAENGGIPDEDLWMLFDPWGGEFFAGMDVPLAAATAQRREDLVRERQDVAARAATAEGGARGAAVDAYVGLATQHTADPQNTHDTGALTCLKAILYRLREDQSGQAVPVPPAVRADILKHGAALSEGRPILVGYAVAVVDKTMLGSKVSGLGDATDAECLGRVWLRADDPRNSKVRNQIRQAVFDALVDCRNPTNGVIECSTGRGGRFLNALVLLDFDERNWLVKKLEHFKNDIFELTRKTIDATAEKAASSEDEGRSKAGRLYLARTAADIAAVGDVPDAAVAKLEDTMRDAINNVIDEYVKYLSEQLGTPEPIPTHVVEATRLEALAAIV